MKITEIKTIVVDCFRTNWVFVKVMTDEGLYGIGEGTLEYKEATLCAAIHDLEHGLVGKDPMNTEALCKANMDTVSSRPAPDVPMLFFTSKQMAALAFPSDPQKYLMLARNYTDNKAKYIDVDYGHYLHNEAPDYVAEEISSFIEGLGSSK